MTATEVIQRKEEFIREIGPVFGRLESDYTAPMIERAFMILLRNGMFLPIPKALQGQDVRFEYESPVRRIREQTEAAAARMWALETIELAQVKPEAMDLIKIDGLVRFSAEALGLPKEIVTSADQVQAIREARAQQAAALAEQEQAQSMIGTVDQVADVVNKVVA